MSPIERGLMSRVRQLVGDVTAEQLRYVDWALARDVGVFIPVAGPCGYAITVGHAHPAWSFIVSFDDRGFYFHTASTKSLSAQLRRNPRVEIAFFEASPDGGRMMRVTGRARFLEQADHRERLLADRPWLAGVERSLPEAELVVFVVEQGEVHHWNMAVNGREAEQPRTRF